MNRDRFIFIAFLFFIGSLIAMQRAAYFKGYKAGYVAALKAAASVRP